MRMLWPSSEYSARWSTNPGVGWHWFRILGRRMRGSNGCKVEDESQFSPIAARRATAVLPRSPGLAGELDGRGKGSSARYTARRMLHTLSGSSRRIRPVQKNHPNTRRQSVDSRGRDHSRLERDTEAQKASHGGTAP